MGVDSLLKRTITGALLLSVLLTALAFGGWFFASLWVISLLVAIYEQYKAFKLAGHRIVAWPCYVAMLVSVPLFALNVFNSFLLLIGVVFLSFTLVSLVVLLRREAELTDLMVSLLPIFSIVLPGLCMLQLLGLDSLPLQRLLLSLAFIIPVMGDSGAFFIGSRFGKRKLSPSVSPNKSVEGAVAGLVFSVLSSVIACLIARLIGNVVIPLWHSALFGLIGGILGQIGDLFASAIKRHCKIKDFGNIFPGHGGMMDRLDSILFVSVLMYIYYLVGFAKI